MLLEAELLVHPEAGRTRLSYVRAAHPRALDALSGESADGGMAGVRAVPGAGRQHWHLRSGRNPQPWHGEEAPAGHDDRIGLLFDYLLRVSVLVSGAGERIQNLFEVRLSNVLL